MVIKKYLLFLVIVILFSGAKQPEGSLLLTGKLQVSGTGEDSYYILILARKSYAKLPKQLKRYFSATKAEPIIYLSFINTQELEKLQNTPVKLTGIFTVYPKLETNGARDLMRSPLFSVQSIDEL